jgi:hypothetical protein
MLDQTELDALCETLPDLLNPEELVDILGLSTEDLVEALRGHIADNMELFEDIL